MREQEVSFGKERVELGYPVSGWVDLDVIPPYNYDVRAKLHHNEVFGQLNLNKYLI